MQLQRFSSWVIVIAVGSFVLAPERRVEDRRTNDRTSVGALRGAATLPRTDVELNDDTAPLTAAPPPLPLHAPPLPRADSVWQEGEWHYASSRWTWTEGHWEPTRPGMVLIQPEWVAMNGRWERHAAHWVKDNAKENEAQPVLHPPRRPKAAH